MCVSVVPVMGVGPRQEIQLKVCEEAFLLMCSVELETQRNCACTDLRLKKLIVLQTYRKLLYTLRSPCLSGAQECSSNLTGKVS